MYPISKQASAVLDILRIHLEQKKCKTEVGFKVDEIFASKNTFIIKAQHKEIYAKKVVLSTGGKAQKQYGTDGTSYALAERFGHEVTKLYPSLVQVKTELDKIKGLKGLKEQAIVTACDGSKKLKSQQGEVLFTDYGVSGSAVFQISGHLAKAKNPIIKIEFLPSIDKNSLEKILTDRNKTLPYLSKNDLFCGLINKKIGNNIVKYSNSEKIEDLIFSVKNFSLKVIGLLGFNYAQVTKGGVVTDDVNFSMESKLQKGLYLVGELLDVDGDCGGYNLTFAFVSGILAGKDIKQNLGNNKNS